MHILGKIQIFEFERHTNGEVKINITDLNYTNFCMRIFMHDLYELLLSLFNGYQHNHISILQSSR